MRSKWLWWKRNSIRAVQFSWANHDFVCVCVPPSIFLDFPRTHAHNVMRAQHTHLRCRCRFSGKNEKSRTSSRCRHRFILWIYRLPSPQYIRKSGRRPFISISQKKIAENERFILHLLQAFVHICLLRISVVVIVIAPSNMCATLPYVWYAHQVTIWFGAFRFVFWSHYTCNFFGCETVHKRIIKSLYKRCLQHTQPHTQKRTESRFSASCRLYFRYARTQAIRTRRSHWFQLNVLALALALVLDGQFSIVVHSFVQMILPQPP